MSMSAHGITVSLPDGWDGRIYRRPEGDPTLHAASYALPVKDGDFGTGATARMPSGGAFVCLTEYRPGAGLEPGQGLFGAPAIPLPLGAEHFHSRSLLVGRRDQAGFQHFFTAQGRPFCLYVVVQGHRGLSRRPVARVADGGQPLHPVNGLLSNLVIEPPR